MAKSRGLLLGNTVPLEISLVIICLSIIYHYSFNYIFIYNSHLVDLLVLHLLISILFSASFLRQISFGDIFNFFLCTLHNSGLWA